MRIKATIVAYAFSVQCFENATIVAYAGLRANHIGSISKHITPLIINSLRVTHRHTDMHTYHIHYGQNHFLETRHVLTHGQHTSGLISVS